MRNSKINVSIEPIDNMNRGEFLNLLKAISENTYCDFELVLYIITTSTDTDFIDRVAEKYNIPNTRVIYCADDTIKISEIESNVNIHFDSNYSIINSLKNSNVWGIFVDSKPSLPQNGFKYIKDFDTAVTAIMREYNEENKKC